MTRLQWICIGSAVLLFFVLYFGCERKPLNVSALEKSRALSAESTDINILLQEARAALKPEEKNKLLLLEQELSEALEDSVRVGLLQQLSGTWYNAGHYAIAGYYAQEVATVDETEDSWSIAGTTYTICIQRTQEERIRDFCTGRAIAAFENAISLAPANVRHRVNLALCYAENPPADNPMKGIQMLLDLNQNEPENVLVLNTLARLAIRTGQYDRAIARLEKAIVIEPDNLNSVCLLAQAYEASGNVVKAEEFDAACRNKLK